MNKYFLKYKVSILLFFILTYNGYAQELSVQDVRDRYDQSLLSEKDAIELYNDLEALKTKDALMIAFKGSINGMMCLHDKNPVKRLKYIKSASFYANEAVTMDDDHLEIRFIRFAIESKSPKILGYSTHLEEDKLFLLQNFVEKNFGTIPFQSLETMVFLMEESGEFTSDEIRKLKSELYSSGS